MAGRKSTASLALQKLEERLSCSICLEKFKQPKSLPCQHTFCTDCLGRLPLTPREGANYALNCPICRRLATLPKDGVSGFSTAVHVSDLLEVREVLQRLTDVHSVSCDNCDDKEASGFCQQCQQFLCLQCVNAHHQLVKLFAGHMIMSMSEVASTASQLKPIKSPPPLECAKHELNLAVYCHSCDQLICRDCTIRDHKNHECDPISDKSVFAKYKQEIESTLLLTKQKLTAITCAIQIFDKRIAEITENRDQVKETIRANGDQIIAEHAAVVQQSISELVTKIVTAAEQKLTFMSAQKENALTTAAMLQSSLEYVEGELRMGSQQRILFGKSQMVDNMKILSSQVKEEEYLLTEEPNMKILKSTGLTAELGDVSFSTVASKCTVSVNRFVVLAQRVTFEIVLPITPGSTPLCLPSSLISCQLTAPDTCSINCDIKKASLGKYEVSYRPVTTGPHMLWVRVGNVNIIGSPFAVQVVQMPSFIKTLSYATRCQNISVVHECLIVTRSNCITLLNNKGKEIKRVGFSELKQGRLETSECDGTLTGRYVHVADYVNNQVQTLGLDGELLATVGCKGKQHLQFDCPMGICVHPSGNLYVVDRNNHRVQILKPDLSFLHSFGTLGSQTGQFKYPCHVAVDSSGMVYITDEHNHRIQKFTPEGKFVTQFSNMAKGAGEVCFPRGIAIDNTQDIVYVTSALHKVYMFHASGEYLGEFGNKGRGEGELFFPQALALDALLGRLYVCHGDKRITVYSV